MIAAVAQIELVAPVRAPVVSAGSSRQAPAADKPGVVAQATKETARAPAEPARPVPVVNTHGLRLTVTDAHEVIATIINTETNEVIRHIPAEEMRRAAEVIRAIIGQLIDKVV